MTEAKDIPGHCSPLAPAKEQDRDPDVSISLRGSRIWGLLTKRRLRHDRWLLPLFPTQAFLSAVLAAN